MVAPWGLATLFIVLYVAVGLAVAKAPRSAWRALRGAPRFVLLKPLRMRGILGFEADSWVRTERPTATTPDGAVR